MLQKITTCQNETEGIERQREESQEQIPMSPIFEEITV